MNGVIQMKPNSRSIPISALSSTVSHYGEGMRRIPAMVIDDVLDFSKIEGKLVFEPIKFSLRMLDATLRWFAAGPSERTGTVEVDADVPDAVIADRRRLRQFYVDLAGDAIVTGASEVLIKVIRSVPMQNALLRFSVADTGIRIPVEAQPLHFEPFVQVGRIPARGYQQKTHTGLVSSGRLIAMMK